MAERDENKNLGNFTWDDWSAGDNVLPVKKEEPIIEQEKKVEEVEVSKEKPAAKETTKVETEVIEKELDLSFDDENQEEETKKETSSIVSKFKSEGIFSNLTEEDLKDVSDDDVPALMEKELEARIDETFQAFFEDMDEDGIAFLKFKKEGGDTKEFLKAYAAYVNTPQGSIEDVNYQKQVITAQLKEEGSDAEDIKDRLAWLEENGKLKSYAQKYEAKLLEKEKANREKLLEQQQKEVIANKEKREALSKNLMKTLDENESIGSLVINKGDKKQLHQYITKPIVKVGKDEYITKMQHDLTEVFKNPEKILILGKLLSSGFDFSEIERSLETKVTKKAKEKIDGKSTIIKSSSSNLERPAKKLSDYF